ncbi:hypothetical protein LEP1GSC088_1786 [Leptospira interrogans str. L1207]|nr:hypothetical protein LEP1GSC088_1786 [Leptospira interrogans str. L1207]
MKFVKKYIVFNRVKKIQFVTDDLYKERVPKPQRICAIIF